jgi:hypothetical protein
VKFSRTSLFSALALACAAAESVNHSTFSLRTWQIEAQNANSKNNRLMSQQKQRILHWIFEGGAIGNLKAMPYLSGMIYAQISLVCTCHLTVGRGFETGLPQKVTLSYRRFAV